MRKGGDEEQGLRELTGNLDSAMLDRSFASGRRDHKLVRRQSLLSVDQVFSRTVGMRPP